MLKWKKGPDNKEERKIMDSKVHKSYVCSYSTGILYMLHGKEITTQIQMEYKHAILDESNIMIMLFKV